ncbi:MAG TPA: hypothetical protein VFW34_07210 [Candidatus Rubrimentiphilum sp.]|nr:hypothetical protein [Candidatus Rubrimentiphilum sp.]
MTGFSRSAVFAALVAALSLSVPAAAQAAGATLDASRIFDRNAESFFSLAPSRHSASTFGAALFNVAVTDSLTLPAPAATQTIAVARVHLTLPGEHAQPAQNISAEAFATSAPIYADDAPLTAPLTTQQDAVSLPAIARSFTQTPAVRFGAYQPYVPTLQSVTAELTVPVRIGALHFSGQLAGAGMQSLHPDAFHILQVCGTTDQAAPCPYVSDARAQSFTAATNFTLRTGNERLGIQLTGGVERIGFQQDAAFPYVPANPDPVFGGPSSGTFDPQAPVLYYPGLTNLTKRSVGAKLAVPVTPRVTVGLQYEQQHYQGQYGALLFPGLDARKDTYLGNVTYQMPSGSSAITLSARQYHYQDSYAPDYNLKQTRADLNFTVKF